MAEMFRDKSRKWLTAIRTGGLSLRKQIEIDTETQEEQLPPGPTGDYERFLPPSLYSLAENIERNPQYLRECFAYMLVTMADAYDSLDHRNSPDYSGTELQDDCQATRELARSFKIPPHSV